MKVVEISRLRLCLYEWGLLLLTSALFLTYCIPAAITKGLDKRKMMQVVVNGKHIATLAKALAEDGVVTGDPGMGWPGDLAAAAGNAKVTSLGDYVERFISYDYIKRDDVGRLFGGPGIAPWDGAGRLTSEQSAFKVFKITKADPGQAILLETQNYTYNQPLAPSRKPFGDTAFVVTRKDGSSVAYRKEQFMLATPISTLPGQPAVNFSPGEETPAMILP